MFDVPVLLLSFIAAAIGIVVLIRLRQTRTPRNWILIDGSNVMHWKDGEPRLETLRDVVDHLARCGFTPGVVFDANVGHLLIGRYQHHHQMARHLGLPESRVMVVPKGTPADPLLLTAARDYNAQIVTNDRYRDWADSFPEVQEPGHLIRGGYRRGQLWFNGIDAQAPN